MTAIIRRLLKLFDSPPETEMDFRRQAKPDVGFDMKARERTARLVGIKL